MSRGLEQRIQEGLSSYNSILDIYPNLETKTTRYIYGLEPTDHMELMVLLLLIETFIKELEGE